MRPNDLYHSRQRPRKVCFVCKKEGHFLRDFPQRDHYCRRFQYFCDIGDDAAFILLHKHQEVNDPAHKVLAYFIGAKAELAKNQDYDDEANEYFETWISDLFSIFDIHDFHHVSTTNSSALDNNSYGYIPL